MRMKRTLAIFLTGAFSAAVAGQAQGAAITDNLLAWWDFESIGPGNTITDVSGNGQNLSMAVNPYLSGGALPTLGAGVGGGLSLQSAPTVALPIWDPYTAGGIAYLPDPDPDSPVSFYGPIQDANPEASDFNAAAAGYAVQAWINLDNTITHQTILFNRDTGTGISSSRPGWELTLFDHDGGPGANQQLAFVSNATDIGVYQVAPLVSLGINVWHHILFTSGSMYLNGVLIATGFGAPSIAPSAHDLFLGAADYAIFGSIPLWNQPLQGRMDKVALWDRTITAEEVALLYNQGNGYSLPQQQQGDGVPAPGSLALLGLGVVFAFARRPRRAQ